MGLIDAYPMLKPAHVGLVIASGTVFAVRGGAGLAGAGWTMARPWRVGSMVIDTLLLAAGALLWAALALNPVSTAPWLGVKLLLLPAYIVLGTVALRRGRSRIGRAVAYVAALATLLFMVSVARTHHPLGALSGLGGPT